jgi:hypothetical protein
MTDTSEIGRKLTPDELEAVGYPRNFHDLTPEARKEIENWVRMRDAQPTSPGIAEAEQRFFTAAGGNPPTDEQKAAVAELRGLIVELGAAIDDRVPDGRNKSLALTALEDVQMRANRGIFAPTLHR